MNEPNYWTRLNRKRLSRRTVLAGGLGAAGLAGLAMAGCGGGDDGGPANGGATGAPGTATAQAKQAKRGGIYRHTFVVGPPTLDPFKSSSLTVKTPATFVYSRLFQFDAGPKADKSKLVPVPDAVESYEATPDGLTYTMKLKGNVRFHPPVDRLMTAEDVVFSLNRFFGKVTGFAGAPNASTLAAFIDSYSASDARTVVFKLKKPYPFFLVKLADVTLLHLMPKETGTAFNPEQTMVGSGPFIFEELRPDSLIKFRRNPAWHLGPDVPYVDGAEIYFLSGAALDSQFKGGNVDTAGISGGPNVLREFKSAVNATVTSVPSLSTTHILFSLDDPDAPWLKPEVRQAMSMALDRNAILDASYDLNSWKAEGFEVSYPYDNFIPAAHREYWLEPQSDAAVAKLFKYDPEGAKKLLAQAGYPNGFSSTFTTADIYGRTPSTATTLEVALQMLSKVGINLAVKSVDFASGITSGVWLGKYDGTAVGQTPGLPDPMDYLSLYNKSTSPRNWTKFNDPGIDSRIDKIESTMDPKEAQRLIKDLVKYMDEKMPYIPLWGGGGRPTTVYAGNIMNAKEYGEGVNLGLTSGIGSEFVPYLWKDPDASGGKYP